MRCISENTSSVLLKLKRKYTPTKQNITHTNLNLASIQLPNASLIVSMNWEKLRTIGLFLVFVTSNQLV
jgi:hypothetical protein